MARLLFDEPLSERLCEALADVFPGALHIRLLGRGGAGDGVVRELAREHGCMIASKDEDFHRLAVLLGGPPKFIWIGWATAAQMTSRCSSDGIARTSLGSINRTKLPCWS